MIAFGRRRGAAPENATTSSIAEILVTAITPALIMILIGSLVFFLISVFYVGEFQARLKYICALFVFATVLIGRISIEEGSEHAAIYGVGLGIAILLAMSRFSDAGLVINIALIAVVWFSAHKLTWDCTVLRQGKDASGQGLLQTAGLDDDDNDGPSQDLDAVSQTSDDDDDDQPTADLAEDEPANPLAALFQRWKEHRKRPHAPGVWVIYFCVASIPLFGMGQILMPSDPLTRRRAFLYLCVYVGAGLALLCATSFLSLRRYLRQRRLEMPPEMAATWSAVGAAMIVALLIFCMMLPRPNPEYSVSDWAPEWSSPISLNSSDWGWGEEGVKDREQADQSSQPEQQGDDGRGPQGKGERDDQSTTGSQSGGSQSGNRQGKQQGGKQQGGKQQGGKQQGGKQQGGKQQGGKQQGGKQQGGKQQGGKQQGGKQQGGKQQGGKAATRRRSTAEGRDRGRQSKGRKNQGGRPARRPQVRRLTIPGRRPFRESRQPRTQAANGVTQRRPRSAAIVAPPSPNVEFELVEQPVQDAGQRRDRPDSIAVLDRDLRGVGVCRLSLPEADSGGAA